MGKENLVQYKDSSTPEERRERASRAGVASGVARRKRKMMRDVFNDLMGAGVTELELIEQLANVGLPFTQEAAICYAAVKKAQTGDIEACRFVRDTLGEKPVEGVAIGSLIDMPVESIDLSMLTDEELRAMIALGDNERDVDTPELSAVKYTT